MNNNLVTNITIDDVDNMYTSTSKQNATPKNTFDPNNYLNTQLEDGQTSKKITIRILPISATESSPFVEIKTHGLKVDKRVAKRGYKSFICLNSKNIDVDRSKRCPICEKATEYYKMSEVETDESKKKAYLEKAKSMFSKTTYIARVVERGKEHEGVKFWRFNGRNDEKDPYHLIQNLFLLRREESIQAGQNPYNIYDLMNGKDLILDITRNVNGRGVTISVSDAGFSTPLHNDLNIANSLISDSKVWTDMYGIKDAEYLTIIANDYAPIWDKEKRTYVPFDPKIEKVVDVTTDNRISAETIQDSNGTKVWTVGDVPQTHLNRNDATYNNQNTNGLQWQQPQQLNSQQQGGNVYNQSIQQNQVPMQGVVQQPNVNPSDDLPF